jgi:uncharacterized membrane protein
MRPESRPVAGPLLFLAAMVEPKDVVLAMLGASAALAGFVLVFLGIVITSFQSYTGSVPEEVVQPFRTVGGALLGMFGLSLISVLACLVWLVGGGPADGYGPVIGVFVAQIAAVFVLAVWATRMVLW